jgi:hypothetical protein
VKPVELCGLCGERPADGYVWHGKNCCRACAEDLHGNELTGI